MSLLTSALLGPHLRGFTLFIALAIVFAGVIPPRASAQSVPSGFSDDLVMGGFSAPVGFVFDDNDRMYVWEKGGKVKIVENGVVLPTPLLDISEEVANWRDHGMLGFALDPDFLVNGHIYVLYGVDRHHLLHYGTGSYNPNTNSYYAATIMRLTRYTAQSSTNFTTVDPASRWVIVGANIDNGVPLIHQSHSTGTIVFGTDGTLLAAVGDGASYSSTDVGSASETYWQQALSDGIIRLEENVGAYRSQMVGSYNGNLLRIDPVTGEGLPSNPFYDPADPSSVASRTWAIGLRNPFRMTLREGTGSTDPTVGNPGSIYIGDVGWGTWEDIHVSTEGGQNFGWPVFEGLENHNGYTNASPYNLDAPNPLYDGTTCSQEYFKFTDLLIQDTPLHNDLFPNPCDPSLQIPSNIPTFVHTRPVIDIRHGSNPNARTGIFQGNTAAVVSLNDPSSPVPGPVFNGNAAVGGVWLSGDTWPAGYQDTYFHADYTKGWIKRIDLDGNDMPIAAYDFAGNLGAVVFLNEGPDGCLWYVQYGSASIRRICPLSSVNLPPVARATQDVVYGAVPLTINFDGSSSSDPESQPLTYDWDFGDGNSSTAVAPSHTFHAAPNVPTAFTVTLTVMDDEHLAHSTTLKVYVNNSPPVIDIISFADSTTYPVGIDTTFALQAYVVDAEHGPNDLSYEWVTRLHHDLHEHPEAPVHQVNSTAVVSGEGCDGNDYWYSATLKVTDAEGLSSSKVHHMIPRCNVSAPIPIIVADPSSGTAPLLVQFDGTNSYDEQGILEYDWDFGDGTTAAGDLVSHTFSDPGLHVVTMGVTNLSGVVRHTTVTIDASGGSTACIGNAGGLLREYWSNIGGSAISTLTNDPDYPSSPDATNVITAFQGPSNIAENYGTRVRGYLIPNETGEHIFNITGDNDVELYLSTDTDPANMQLIASINGYTGPTQFNKYSSQRSVPINLTTGEYYYVEMLHVEGSGGDHFATYWETPSNSNLTLIGPQYLAEWQDCPVRLHACVYLGGAYDQGGALMDDALRTAALIPLTEPYTSLGYTQVGGGGETTTNAVLNNTGHNAIVDWVLLELRDPQVPSTIIATRCALLQRDGDVVDVNGSDPVAFNITPSTYNVAIRHRNHLGAMTEDVVPLLGGTTLVDFASASVSMYGGGARHILDNGKAALWHGNVSNDGELKYTGSGNDRDVILQAIGGSVPSNMVNGYHVGDVNMNGVVQYTGMGNDRDPILQAIGGDQPTLFRTEQLP